VDTDSGESGSGAMISARILARARAGQDSAHVGPPLWVGRAARVVWVPFALMCAALVVTDAAIRYHEVAGLTRGIPGGWTPATLSGALRQLGITTGTYAGFGLVLTVASALVWFGAAALVVSRGWSHAMAKFTAYFLVLFGAAWLVEPGRLPAGIRAEARFLDSLSWAAFVLFFLLFPSGRFAPRWLRWPVLSLSVVSLIAAVIAPAATAGSYFALWLCMLAVAAAAQVWRYRAVSTSAERRQTRWLVFGFSATVLAVATLYGIAGLLGVKPPSVSALVVELAGQTLGTLLFLPIPVAVVIGLTRHGLWDIDVLVNRALLYGGLSLLVAVIYGLTVGSGLLVAGGRGLAASILIGMVVAVLFNPARSALQDAVNRLMYGQREEPYRLLTRMGAHLEGGAEPAALLSSIAETVTRGLRLPYAAIVVFQTGGPSLAAESGQADGDLITVPLVHHGAAVGELQVAPRAGEDELTRADRRLLEDLARPVAASVRALALTAELQRARERLVLAREEERRELRRELHDGLGPSLATHRLKLGTVRALLSEGDTAGATRILRDLEAELSASVDAVRSLAYQLRPPVLDDLGLVEALRSLAADAASPRVSVRVIGAVQDLPAAVEAAAYRISREALTNVRRHADARTCALVLEACSDLTITISDDGRGMPPGAHHGVGLNSMRERAEELGGTLSVDSPAGGGTRVVAVLPCPGTQR
jgi:signal transduction histidine kinase